MATSTYYLGGDVGQGIGPMIGGFILAQVAGNAGYQLMFWFCAAIMLIAMVYFFFFLRKEKIK